MKRILLIVAGAISFAAPALAADLPARTYKAPVAIPPVYDWSGFYIGANGGYGWTKDRWIDIGTVPATDWGSHTAKGAVAGGQLGYRWQLGSWVLGLEAQGDWADIKGSHFYAPFADTYSSKLKAFGLFTGQVGYAWNNALFYAKGGAAITSNKWTATNAGVLMAATGELNRWGGAIGAGFEYGFAPNWSVGVEYDHLFTGRHNADFYSPAGVYLGTPKVGGDTDLVTARVNYRWGGPVVAKY